MSSGTAQRYRLRRAAAAAKKAELRTEDGVVALDVHDQLASSLGAFFNKQVVVAAEKTTRWLINTGTEKLKYRMFGIRLAETDADAHTPPGHAVIGQTKE